MKIYQYKEKKMQIQKKGLLQVSVMTACILAVSPNVFAEPVADKPVEGSSNPDFGQEFVTSDELQTRMLNTLDNAQGVAAGIGMSEILGDQIEAARASVLSATPQELDAIPPNLYSSLKILEVGSGQMRLAYDPELRDPDAQAKNASNSGIQAMDQGMMIQSAGGDYVDSALDDPAYPGQDWSFSFEAESPDGDANDVDGGEGEEHGSCHAPGSTYPARVAALNAAIVANAVNDIAGHFCDWTIVVIGGGNVSPLCVVTQVVASVTTGIDENMSLCNEHIGAAEVSATWEGLKTVHGNVQHVHGDIATVDADLASHDADIKSQITTHDTDIKSQVTTHDVAIQSQLATHDADLKQQLATHDADIKARLGEIQGTVDENQRLLKITMARQLEIFRLLITPQGRREINMDVLTCTGDDCPVAVDLQCGKNDLGWPCK